MTPAQNQAFLLVQGIVPKYSHAINSKEWDFREFLMAMTSCYHKDVSTYDNADGIELLVEEFEITLVSLYDHPHDSDESSSVDMLLVKGIPLIGWKRVGDRSDYSDGLVVLNDAEGRSLAKRVWEIVHTTESMDNDNLDVAKWLFEDNQYVRALDIREDSVAYAINSPRCMLGSVSTEKSRLYAMKPNASDTPSVLALIVRIVSVSMCTDDNKYSRNAFHRSVVEFEDGTQCEVETDRIVHTPLRAIS